MVAGFFEEFEGSNASGCIMDRHALYQRLDGVHTNGDADLQSRWTTVSG